MLSGSTKTTLPDALAQPPRHLSPQRLGIEIVEQGSRVESNPRDGIALDQQPGVADRPVTQQWWRLVEHDDVDFVGAKSFSGEASQFELQLKPASWIEPGLVPHGDVNVRKRSWRATRLRTDQHRRDDTLPVERMAESLQRGRVERWHSFSLVNDDHRSHRRR